MHERRGGRTNPSGVEIGVFVGQSVFLVLVVQIRKGVVVFRKFRFWLKVHVILVVIRFEPLARWMPCSRCLAAGLRSVTGRGRRAGGTHGQVKM